MQKEFSKVTPEQPRLCFLLLPQVCWTCPPKWLDIPSFWTLTSQAFISVSGHSMTTGIILIRSLVKPWQVYPFRWPSRRMFPPGTQVLVPCSYLDTHKSCTFPQLWHINTRKSEPAQTFTWKGDIGNWKPCSVFSYTAMYRAKFQSSKHTSRAPVFIRCIWHGHKWLCHLCCWRTQPIASVFKATS